MVFIMGIQTEYNPDIALRNISCHKNGEREIEECVPEILEVGKVYDFLKKGQRIYWFGGEMPLLETDGNQNLSRPLASIIVLEAVHFVKEGTNGEVWTKGKYKVVEVFDVNDEKVHFDGFSKVD